MTTTPTQTQPNPEAKYIQLFAAQVSALSRIAIALETLAQANAPAPNFVKPIGAYHEFDFTTIGAKVVARDRLGVTAVEWGGYQWTRRSPANKFDVAIWFSRPNGKDLEGEVKWLRLITFKKTSDAEEIPTKVASKAGLKE